MARTPNSFGNYNGFSVGMTQMFFENGADLMIPVTAATPLPVTSVAGGSVTTTPSASELHLGEIGGRLVAKSGTFARPADTNGYAANDVVSNNATTTTPFTVAGVARVNGGSGYIVGMRLLTDKKSITPRFRVHLLSSIASLTVAADNAAYKAVYADIGKRVGSYDLAALSTAADTTNSDYSGVSDFTMRIPFVCGAGLADLYAVLETLDAFTPASGENFSLTLICDEN